MLNDVRSVYLWGCFTGTAGAMLRWRVNYSKLNVVAGFKGRSPLGDLKNSYELLRKLMIKEAEIKQEETIVGVSRVVRSVNYEYLTALTYLQGECFVSGLRKKEKAYIYNLPDDCIGRVTFLLTKQKDSFLPFNSGAKALPNPDIGNTPLRHFYDNLQDSFHCLDHCKSNTQKNTLKKSGFGEDLDAHNYDEKKLPCPGEVIRLIKYEHIVENMNHYLEKEIKIFSAKIDKKTTKEKQSCLEIFLADGRNVRKNTDLKLFKFQRCLQSLPRHTYTRKKQKILKELHSSVWNIIKSSNECVPLSWIDEQMNPERILCE